MSYFSLRKPDPTRPGEVNYGLVDRFTFAHFGIGLVYAAIGLEFFIACLLAIAWELIENPLKVNFPRVFPHATADTLKNSVGDTLAVIAGWWLAALIMTS